MSGSPGLREVIVDAAREHTIARGWDSVRMADVASAAGVSRQTVYNEFATKAGLGEALAQREIDRFVADVRSALFAHRSDVRAATYEAVAHTLREAAANPLIKAILTSTGGLLPYLTTRADLVLQTSTAVLMEWATAFLPDLPPADLASGAETIVRLVVSHIVLPLAPPEHTAAALADLAARFVSDAAGPARSATSAR